MRGMKTMLEQEKERRRKKTVVGVRVDDTLLKTILKVAREEGRTTAGMARRLIVESLQRRGLLKGSKLPKPPRL